MWIIVSLNDKVNRVIHHLFSSLSRRFGRVVFGKASCSVCIEHYPLVYQAYIPLSITICKYYKAQACSLAFPHSRQPAMRVGRIGVIGEMGIVKNLVPLFMCIAFTAIQFCNSIVCAESRVNTFSHASWAWEVERILGVNRRSRHFRFILSHVLHLLDCHITDNDRQARILAWHCDR